MNEIYNVVVIDREGGEFQRLVFSTQVKAEVAIDKLLAMNVPNYRLRAFASRIDPELNPDDYKYL